MRRRAAGVDDPLGDPLVVEVGDLLPQVVVLNEDRPPLPAFSEWSVSWSRAPWAVVRYAPLCATRALAAPVAWPVGLTVSGPV